MSLGGWFLVTLTWWLMEFLFLNQIEPGPIAVKAWCPDLWTTRNSPRGTAFENVQVSYWVLGNFVVLGPQMPEGRFSLGLSCLRKMPLTGGCSTWSRDGPCTALRTGTWLPCAGTNPSPLSWLGSPSLLGLEAPLLCPLLCARHCLLFPH